MKSSTIVSTIAAILCAGAVLAADVWVGVDYETAYVPSGTTVNDGSVLWPCVEVSGMKIGETALPLVIGFWGNMDLDDSFDSAYKSGRFSEIDLWANLDLAQMIGDEDLTFYVGYLEYDYPRIGAETDHVFDAKVGYAVPYLNPSLRLKWRVGGPSTGKYELIGRIGHDIPLADTGVSLGLEADCTYIGQESGSELDDGFACSFLTAKLSWKDFYVSGSYIVQIDDDVLPDATSENPYGYDVEWVGAVGWGRVF
ncbi:MAG: hypothetical protein ACOX5G_04565 [Kiritimatiellia bacterium]|jgi:hypothetical protein